MSVEAIEMVLRDRGASIAARLVPYYTDRVVLSTRASTT